MENTINVKDLAGEDISPEDLKYIESTIKEITEKFSTDDLHQQVEMWEEFKDRILNKHELDFDIHKALYSRAFGNRKEKDGPPPAWTPQTGFITKTNIGQLMVERQIKSYKELHRWSVENYEDFWQVAIEKMGVLFKKDPKGIVNLDKSVETPEWLPGAELNIVDSCFKANPDKVAIVYQKEGSKDLEELTYKELLNLTNRVANGLKDAGFKPKDGIAIDMPMTMESVAIYLGIIKAGCVAVSIADSFAPEEIATRLRISDAKGMFTMDYNLRGGKKLEIYSKVKDADAPKSIVIPFDENSKIELREGDVLWENFLSDNTEFESVACKPGDSTNILFSSGTTGDPKAIPWTQTTPLKSAADGYFHHNVQEDGCVAWPTNLGWMMGPWLIYASLMNDAKMALYYGAPSGKDFCQFVSDAEVTMLGVVPSLVKAWKEGDAVKGIDWSNIQAFSSTGECSNAENMLFLMSTAGYKPIIEYCGGTEIGGGHITGTVVQYASPATFSTPSLGLDFVILDDEGRLTKNGEIFLIPPSIGLSTTLMNRDHHEVYYEGCPKGPNGEALRRHGDQVERLSHDYFRAHGRVDDTMNLGGIKTSSADIERAVVVHDAIQESAAIAVTPEGGGPSQLVLCTVLTDAYKKTNPDMEQLKKELQGLIKDNLNPLFRIQDIMPLDSLPRTASNKVMRRVLRSNYEKK